MSGDRTSNSTRSLSVKFWAIIVSVGIAVIIGGLYLSFQLATNRPTDTLRPGEFGDIFGFANAAFSGLAFLGLIVAILLQREELGLQRTELEATREELAGQKEQLRLQNDAWKQQNFDATFFHLLNLHNQIVHSVSRPNLTPGENHEIRGRDAIASFLKDFVLPKPSNRDFATHYKNFIRRHMATFGHYLRVMYNIIKFVDEFGVDERKRFYTNLVRAQLSEPELELLAFDCAYGEGHVKFRPLVEKYTLLKHVKRDEPILEDALAKFSWEAFEMV